MNKLKEKILTALKNTNAIDSTFNFISKFKKNLLKNHDNPVFNTKDKI